MTPREKVAAEWEARHDVTARGRRPSSESVQHYLGSSRTRDQRTGAPTRRAPTGQAPTPHPAPTLHRAAPPVAPAPPAHHRPWWRFWDRG
jgi:hypothetical protein